MRELIVRLVDVCARRPVVVVLLALAAAIASAVFVVGNFAMNTDTSGLVSPKLQWRQNEARFDRAFPHRGDLIAVVVDGATPELAEQATGALAQRLSANAN